MGKEMAKDRPLGWECKKVTILSLHFPGTRKEKETGAVGNNMAPNNRERGKAWERTPGVKTEL